MIKFKLNNLIKSTLRDLGINIRKTTKRDLIEGFLNRCYPITTDLDLIRIGENTDGGYLVPNDLGEIYACFSPGVAETASFEKEMISRGIRCYLADFSVEAPPIVGPNIKFEKKFIGIDDDEVHMTLESWVKNNCDNISDDLLLQMDIEGSEYDVIMNTPAEILRRFRIVIIEFHGLDTISDPFGFRIVDTTFRRLLNDFVIVHIHPNNISKPVMVRGFFIPPTMEFTFLRKDKVRHSQETKKFPHELDCKCIPTKRDFDLPQCWYSGESMKKK